jgi:hypothetical protein
MHGPGIVTAEGGIGTCEPGNLRMLTRSLPGR